MKIGVALSGGGIRGIAHAGVLRALEENGIKIDIIGGTSCGSMVASLYAMGYTPHYIYILFKRYAKDIAALNTKPIISGLQSHFFKSKKVFSSLKDGEIIETVYNKLALRKGIKNVNEIQMPLVIPSVDITESKEYVFTNKIPENAEDKLQYITDITVGKAVRASSSFPAFFCPCEYKKHIFMDGGVLDNVPVLPLKQVYDKKIIAVNFEADPVKSERDVMDIIMKTLDIMGNKISEKSLEQSDLLLTVPTDSAGLFDIEKLDKCYQFGYDTVIKNINKIKQV